MSSFFDCIGFDNIRDMDDLQPYLIRVMEQGEVVSDKEGIKSLKLDCGDGAELWGTFDVDGIAHFSTGFAGRTRQKILIEKIYIEPDAADGIFGGWVNPRPVGDAEEEPGDFPILFRVVDFPMQEKAVKESDTLEVNLTGFSYSITAYPNEEAYYTDPDNIIDENDGEPMVFSHQAVVPLSMFVENEDETTDEPEGQPSSDAIIMGTILEINPCVNKITNSAFTHLLVQTSNVQIDLVVYPPEVDGELVIGGVISGAFWVSAHVYSIASKN